MNRDKEDQHAMEIDRWIRQNLEDKTPNQQVHAFAEAVQALHQRSIATLSSITVNAVLDRAIHESQRQFHCLSGMSVQMIGLSFDGLLAVSHELDPCEIIPAVRYLLMEFVTILDNLTGGILTKPLYQELIRVTEQAAAPGDPGQGDS